MEKQPLLTHLSDLRQCLSAIALYILIGSLLSYGISDALLHLSMRPLSIILKNKGLLDSHRMIYTGMAEAFLVHIKLAVFFGACLTSPLWLMRLWRFIAPALYMHEKKSFRFFFLLTPVLFTAGSAFAYFLVLPNAYAFFLSFEMPGSDAHMALHMDMRLMEFLSFMMRLVLAFGLTFQLPIFMHICHRLNWISAKQFRENWRFVVLGIFSLSAFMTPPDVFSMIALALPLIILYAISIVFISRT
jgi:sec-independent protein translocase protein TatC